MKRRIITIDEEKCIGCGACADACHEGAIVMENGKAKLLREDYCDGLGDCLPACPADAIHFEEREAAAYDEKAVQEHLKQRNLRGMAQQSSPQDSAMAQRTGVQAHSTGQLSGAQAHSTGQLSGAQAQPAEQASGAQRPAMGGCPGSRIQRFQRDQQSQDAEQVSAQKESFVSQLQQWPVQIKLVPVNAPYFQGAKLLIAADCTAYACAGFHERFIKGHITLVGCPKLDSVDYSEKLAQILQNNEIKSITVVRMEVPCCGGIEAAVRMALQKSGKIIPWQVKVISTDGTIMDD